MTVDRRQRLERLFAAINRWPDYAAGAGTVAMLISVLIQIVSRLSGRPVAWTEEGTRFLFIWIIFLGIAIGFRKAESARVTFFIDHMPRPVRRLAPYIYAIFTIGFFTLMLVKGAGLALQQYRTNEMGSALMIPMWTVGICVPVSGMLGILGVIEQLLLRPELVKAKGE